MAFLDFFRRTDLQKFLAADIAYRPATDDGGHRVARAVAPDNTPLHVKRGWTRQGSAYRGWYRTKFGAWRGEVENGAGFRIFIFSPPMHALDRHEKRPCFQFRGNDKWYLNLFQQPARGASVDDCIRYVEQILVEAHAGRPPVRGTPF